MDVVALRFFKARFEPGSRHSAKIYDSLTGSLLATTGNFTDLVKTYTYPTAPCPSCSHHPALTRPSPLALFGVPWCAQDCPGPRWVSAPLAQPFRLQPGKEYVAAVDSVSMYSHTAQYFPSKDKKQGPVTPINVRTHSQPGS